MNEVLHLLTDPAHWSFEIISGALIGLTLTPLWRLLMRRHDFNQHDRGSFDEHVVSDLSHLYQRIERLEASRATTDNQPSQSAVGWDPNHYRGYTPWRDIPHKTRDDEGMMGL